MTDDKSKLVYSTEQAISRKEKPVKKALQNARPVQLKVTVRLDRKGRGGKTVTVVDGLHMTQNKMEELLGQLKAKLGAGGTVKDTSLEIQGDHRDILMSALGKMGYTPKRSG